MDAERDHPLDATEEAQVRQDETRWRNNGREDDADICRRSVFTNYQGFNRISNYAKRGCFVISDFTILGYLMQKGKKKHKKLRFDVK